MCVYRCRQKEFKKMICTLICKKRETEDGRKWINYSMLKGKKWYNVKFVKDCAPPSVNKISDGILRAFIELTPEHLYDIKDSLSGSVLFVESYGTLSAESLEECLKVENAKIVKYKSERDKAKLNFIAEDTDDNFYL